MNPDADPLATARARLPHAVLDRDSRVWKARKIIALLGDGRFARARRVLEIGCGSGVIAKTLAELGGEQLVVDAVDVVDNRIDKQGYAFQTVAGTALPFATGVFDVVISNHVIEHVGAPDDQLLHLQEIRRVLAPDGICYLAVPNRWRLVEPHYRLPFLSWLSASASDRYVRLSGRGSHYDCVPLAFEQARALFEAAGFESVDVTLRALRETLAIEMPCSAIARGFNRYVPDWMPGLAKGIMPTFVFLLKPRT